MTRVQLSASAYRRITLLALGALGFIVVTGAAVRLTGSGLGCPSWPNCEPDSLVPRDATDSHALIEFANRTITGLVSVAVIAAVLGARYRQPRRADLSRWSWGLVAGVIGQVVLGGMTVLVELAPPFVMAHFLLSAVLVTCAVVLHHRAGEPDGGRRRPVVTSEVRRVAWSVVGLASVVLVTGTTVTGTGPHGGDEDVERLRLGITTVARVHSSSVWVLVAVTVWLAWKLWRNRAPAGVLRAAQVLLAVEVAQGALGYTQYALGVPERLVLGHVLGSMVVLIAALSVALRTTEVRTPAPAAGSDGSSGAGEAGLVAPEAAS